MGYTNLRPSRSAITRARGVHQHSCHLRAGPRWVREPGHGAVCQCAGLHCPSIPAQPSRLQRGQPIDGRYALQPGRSVEPGVVPPFAYSAIASVAGDPRPYQTSMFPALETFSYTLNTTDAYAGGYGNTTNFAGSCGASRRGKWAASGAWLGRSSAIRCIWPRRCGVTPGMARWAGWLYQ